MRPGTGVENATERALPPFGVALGHRLRQVREESGETAAQLADRASSWFGLRWDRSTLTRIELGQRQVTAPELLLLPAVYDRSLAELLPIEACRLSDVVNADPAAMRDALARSARGYELEKVREALSSGQIKKWLEQVSENVTARFLGVPAMLVMGGASHAKDEATVKAARRLDADPWDVAVASFQLWDRDLASERDERVGQRAESMRARQARRGHVTRQLLEELRPVVQALQASRSTEGVDGDGER